MNISQFKGSLDRTPFSLKVVILFKPYYTAVHGTKAILASMTSKTITLYCPHSKAFQKMGYFDHRIKNTTEHKSAVK